MFNKDSYDYMQGVKAVKNDEYKLAGHTPAYYSGYDDFKKAMRMIRKMRAVK